MTPEVPITRQESRLYDDSENVKHRRQNSVVSLNEVNESDVTSSTTENHRSWSLDDIEGVVMEILDDITVASAGHAMEKTIGARLFGFIATWGLSIIDDTLVSAIAPTGDICVDSNDVNILNNTRLLLGRNDLPLENLDPPKSSPLDESYQRRQIPIRVAKQNQYDSEGLHHAVKAATRSHAYPASVASSRLTVKSKVRRKQHGATTVHVEVTGPQPGIPYSTAAHDSNKGRNHILSPRKAMAVHHPVDTTESRDPGGAASPHGVGLQLNIKTKCIDQVASARPSRSSPSSLASPRPRPHPPGSAQHRRVIIPVCFGEKEDEVKVEYAVQKSPPLKNSISTKSVLPNIGSGRIAPRPNPAFGVLSNENGCDGHESGVLFNDDQLDQQFHAMPLSPGVKIRAGEESKDGPELPQFASRMRRSTFVRMDTCTLPTQASDPFVSRNAIPIDQTSQVQQLGKGTFLTETAWDFSAANDSLIGDQVTTHERSHHFKADSLLKSDDVSSAEMTISCSCGSSSSLTLFRKQSKVQRPCRSCNNVKSESTPADAMNVTNLVKQRAFHLKPPCLPTSAAPIKRAPGASPRRVASAPASSPLARRNLLLNSNKAPQLPSRDLHVDRATQIM